MVCRLLLSSSSLFLACTNLFMLSFKLLQISSFISNTAVLLTLCQILIYQIDSFILVSFLSNDSFKNLIMLSRDGNVALQLLHDHRKSSISP